MSQLVQQAIALHQQGRLAEAEALYRQVLAQTPDEAGPYHYIGVIRMQQGRLAEAVPLLEEALRRNPFEAPALVNHGMTLRLLGRTVEALASFDRAAAAAPAMPDAHFQRGLALGETARPQEALAAYDRAVTLHPQHIGALFHRALLLGDLGRPDEARASYDSLLMLQPGHVEALSNRGLLAWARRDADAALADWTRALASDPRHAPSLTNRALVLGETGRAAEALADYERLLVLAPNDAEMWNRRGATLRALDRESEALESFDTALRLNPDFATALNNRGFLRWAVERRHDEAKADLARALVLEPQMPWLKGELAYLKMQGADWDGRDAGHAALAADIMAGQRVVRPFAWQAISADPASLQQCSRLFAADQFPTPSPARWPMPMRERIRIGYVSADFREQATAYLMAGVYEAHDRSRFEITAFDNGFDDGSPMRTRLAQAFGGFTDIAALSDAQAAAAMREAGIDILVNLNGYFGRPRSGVFAQRPAPVQVNYLGFPATLGAPWMDYIIADRSVIPEGERHFYDEAVAWLPHSYQANDARRARPAAATREAAGLPAQGFVFCNFNQLYKLTPEIFAIWLQLLQSRDDSVLWLLRDNDVAVANLRRVAEEQGIAADRLIFAEPLELDQHLARLALADLFLDTLPYNAHTTASDALWAGVPLLTCRGTAFAGRVAASLLTAMALPELITGSLAEYEKLATLLAQDTARLADIRTRLAAARDTSPLFDTARFTRDLEAAYGVMAQTSRAGRAPQGFAVP